MSRCLLPISLNHYIDFSLTLLQEKIEGVRWIVIQYIQSFIYGKYKTSIGLFKIVYKNEVFFDGTSIEISFVAHPFINYCSRYFTIGGRRNAHASRKLATFIYIFRANPVFI